MDLLFRGERTKTSERRKKLGVRGRNKELPPGEKKRKLNNDMSGGPEFRGRDSWPPRGVAILIGERQKGEKSFSHFNGRACIFFLERCRDKGRKTLKSKCRTRWKDGRVVVVNKQTNTQSTFSAAGGGKRRFTLGKKKRSKGGTEQESRVRA